VYDLYNVRSSWRELNYIEVNNKNVEVYGLLQRMLPELNWNQYKYTYDVAGSDWDWSRENTSTVDSIIASYYLTLDRANYVNDGYNGLEFSTVRRYNDTNSVTGFSETTGPYQWKALKTHEWNDGAAVTWDMMRVGSDINSSFMIDLNGYSSGYKIFIKQIDVITNVEVLDEYTITSTYPTSSTDLAAWSAVSAELSGLSDITHPLLSKFNFNPVIVDTNSDGILDKCEYILVVANEPSRAYDFSEVGFDNVLGGIIVAGSEVHFTSYNPDFNDVYIIDTHVEVNRLNHVTFSYDTTKMPGIASQKWTLKNNSKNVGDIYYSNTWLTYLFKHKGDYNVELEVTDVNGNKNVINKNILKII